MLVPYANDTGAIESSRKKEKTTILKLSELCPKL